MDETYDGRLESWSVAYNSVIGNIYYDSKDRFYDGALIRTSKVQEPALEELKEGDVVETRNSKYVLGKPYDDWRDY